MRTFWLLDAEAVGDAFRRRIVGGVAIAGLLAIATLESCTGCAPAINVNGEVRELEPRFRITVAPGDAIEIETPGGGGFGRD